MGHAGGKEPAQTRAPIYCTNMCCILRIRWCKKDRQGPCPPRTHHLHGETHKYTTGCMIRAVKRQIQGVGKPGEVPDPAWVEGMGRLPGGVDVYAKIKDE